MHAPSVTVVIPCYNAEKFIDDAIWSVRQQYYRNIRIIVVDDKSTDGSILKVLQHQNVALIQHHKNKGPCAAVETGFMNSTSDYTCMLAADDMFINQNHISSLVQIMETHHLDWCYTTINKTGRVEEESLPVQSKWFLHHALDNFMLNFPRLCCLMMMYRNPVNSSAMLIRTESFRKYNLSWYPETRSVCDGYLLADIFLKGLKGMAIHSCDVFYRVHDNQVSNTELHCENVDRFREMILERVIGF
jgi:glycosyltransferase involved in cell wall biosynthesis